MRSCTRPGGRGHARDPQGGRRGRWDDGHRHRNGPGRRRHRDVAGGARCARPGAGLENIRSNYNGAVQRGRLDAAAAEARIGRIRGSLEPGVASDADLAIEAVFEDLDLKRSLLARLDPILPEHAVLASNTSSLSLGVLADSTRRPDRVIGLHFFSPANVMRLLEIVRGARTSNQTILASLALAKTLRKIGVVVGDGFGFVGNRMMLDGYFRESELMLLQGVAPARIDTVMEAFGFAMGPNRVNDMAGIDVGTRVRTELLRRAARPAPYHVVSDALTALGHLGQKSGRGIYRYVTGDRAPHPEPELEPLIAALAAKHAIAPRDVSDTEIERRCVLQLVNIGAAILAEGLAYRASDIDVIWTSGYGFPHWRGGPCTTPIRWASRKSSGRCASSRAPAAIRTGRFPACCSSSPRTAAASPIGIANAASNLLRD